MDRQKCTDFRKIDKHLSLIQQDQQHLQLLFLFIHPSCQPSSHPSIYSYTHLVIHSSTKFELMEISLAKCEFMLFLFLLLVECSSVFV